MTSQIPVISADDVIEGPFKDLDIVIVTKEHRDAISKFLDESFTRDEPLCKSINNPEYSKIIRELVKEGLYQDNNQSLVAIDQKTGEIAGFRISKVVTREMEEKENEDFISGKMNYPEFLQPVFKMMLIDLHEPVGNEFDIFKVEKIVDYRGLSVRDKYRGLGLGHEMLVRSLRLAKKDGFRVVRGIFSSLYSRRPAEKVGFIVYNEIFYDDFKVNGKVLFDNMKPHTSMIIAFREL